MQRTIWSVEEIAKILVATNEANVNADQLAASGTLKPEEKALARAYREGFKAALTCVALAVGVPVKGSAERDARTLPPEDSPTINVLPAD
jgi:hypothetical protein